MQTVVVVVVLVTLPMEGHVRGKEIVFCYNFCVVTDYFG
jgi:hypothetical protein